MPRSLTGSIRYCITLVALCVLGASCSSSPTQPSLASSKAGISHAYSVLFDLSNPAVTPKVAVVQDGSSIQGAMEKELSSPLAKSASGAKVDSIKLLDQSSCKSEILSYPCAEVSYEIILPSMSTGNLTGLKGFAIYSSGKWLVSKKTICALFYLAANDTTLPGC